MNTQDRAVVKALLQYMTERYLTGSEEFRAALKHFNITTTAIGQKFTDESAALFADKPNHFVDVFSPDTIDNHPHGLRSTADSKDEAEAYAADARATGDEPTVPAVDEAAAARSIIARAIHVGANSSGGIIGEHEELVETLRNSGFPEAADKVDAIYGWCVGSNHKDFRKNWLESLRNVSASI